MKFKAHLGAQFGKVQFGHNMGTLWAQYGSSCGTNEYEHNNILLRTGLSHIYISSPVLRSYRYVYDRLDAIMYSHTRVKPAVFSKEQDS